MSPEVVGEQIVFLYRSREDLQIDFTHMLSVRYTHTSCARTHLLQD